MKLAPRLTLVFIGYATALLIGFAILAYNSGRDSLRSATISELQSTALEKQTALTRWVEEKKADIAVMAGDPDTLEAATVLVVSAPDSAEFRAARTSFIANVRPRLDNGHFLNVSLIHPQTGQVIVSTDTAEEGKFKEDRLFFLNGKNGPYVQNVYYSIAFQSIAMTASAPLRAADGRVFGVLAARLDLEDMNSIVSKRTGLRETDDVYLVNSSNLFVTQPRFISNPAVLQRGVHTEDVRQCLRQNSGVIETPDYRQVPVIAVYHWLSERSLCLVVKMDETEVYRPAQAFGGTIAVIGAAALLIAAFTGSVLAQGLTRPIRTLQEGAARFARGKLDTRLPETSHDELGQLAGEFNKMAQALAQQQSHLLYRAEQFFSLTPDLLCTITPAGQLIDTNPAWQNILGYRHEELRGYLLTNLLHPDDEELTRSALQEAAAGPAERRFESRFRHKTGDYRWLAWAVVISPQDRLLYAAARDITERQLAEVRLRAQAGELERSNRELEQFAYVASHDLQEPLRIVSSYVQLLARRYSGRLDQDADEFISFTVEGVSRMKNMINDLLAYSKVGSRGREFAPVAMEGILTRVMDHLQLAIGDHDAAVTHDPLPVVQGDDLQMTQLLQNLIGNAIKFRGPTPPRIHVGVRKQDAHWLFFVRDNGIGMDPQYAERIFAIFQRLHSRDEYPGTGIGLAICRKIVEQHGGRIWVDSEPGKGATFYFTLQPGEGPAPAAPASGVKPPRETVADRARDLI